MDQYSDVVFSMIRMSRVVLRIPWREDLSALTILNYVLRVKIALAHPLTRRTSELTVVK